jgi:hypothetical protein
MYADSRQGIGGNPVLTEASCMLTLALSLPQFCSGYSDGRGPSDADPPDAQFSTARVAGPAPKICFK